VYLQAYVSADICICRHTLRSIQIHRHNMIMPERVGKISCMYVDMSLKKRNQHNHHHQHTQSPVTCAHACTYRRPVLISVCMRNLRPLRFHFSLSLSLSLSPPPLPPPPVSLSLSYTHTHTHTPISVALRLGRFWIGLIVIALLLRKLPRRRDPIRTAVLNLFQA
jgi:hypothetical protein